jgi:methylmalonyl-CoA mutase
VVIVETPGIGQGDAAIVPFVDHSLYVMTPEFGAASQLEKIDMLDFADAVAINKFDRRAAADAFRDVRRQLDRERPEVPLFGTIASHFNDDGVTALYQHVRELLGLRPGTLAPVDTRTSTGTTVIVPPARERYLAEVAGTVRGYHAETAELAGAARRRQHLTTARELLPETPELDRLLADLPLHPLLEAWPAVAEEARGHRRESHSGTSVPRVAVPRFEDHGELLRWLRSEHLPGRFPFTAGVFPLKREGEDPARMFAGEGGPARTNRRFHLLAEGEPATRLSTAFDSVTLYGFDPDERPDIYGKVGNSGVSIATLDDMKVLFDGFDLCDPTTSVSMTINGPAPSILAMYLNTAIDQHPELEPAEVLRRVRGTVQADILKEDQGQNTCIFSTEFSLRCMADIQEWFVANQVRNFYSVSISGYHMAEAGANPISQLAFTLANGLTYVEAYLARGMAIDDFAPNLSFFFSNGMDPEYTVLGRVARRIWAVALRDRYGANERSQKLKYHVQTSGRSLHAQEMAFNDIRTTLQALCAIYDNANSLHTNAYNEAVTTPTAESVRRAVAIQLVINREWGLAMNENPLQGSFVVEELTDLVEEAVLTELEAISARGGVLGAMETGYQRGRIQDESMSYERGKHDGSIPIVGVNTFRNPNGDATPEVLELARSDDAEKQDQLRRLHDFQGRHAGERPAALERLQQTALGGGNVFADLMDAVRCCSLGQITDALFEVGGRYRRNV